MPEIPRRNAVLAVKSTRFAALVPDPRDEWGSATAWEAENESLSRLPFIRGLHL
jgi:hypothetical protein